MPLKRGGSKKAMSANFKELGQGETYARTQRRYGAARANKQRVAIVMREAGNSKREPTMAEYAKRRGRAR